MFFETDARNGLMDTLWILDRYELFDCRAHELSRKYAPPKACYNTFKKWAYVSFVFSFLVFGKQYMFYSVNKNGLEIRR